MKSLKKDTLAYQLGMRPAFQPINASKANLPQVVSALKQFMKQSDAYEKVPGSMHMEPVCGSSEVDALLFYMLNHAVSMVRAKVHPLEPLGSLLPIVDLHAREMAVRSSRMFFYLLLICTRESRHNKNNETLHAQWADTFPKSILNFHNHIRGDSSTGAVEKFQKSAPDTYLGTYTEFLERVFFQGKYNSSFGGPKWGEIAKVLNQFVHGKLTAELMMDTGFTLAHNGGPIFNKGMLYEQYSQDLYHILDVQRAGQIPQLCAAKSLKAAKNIHVQTLWSRCRKILGPEFDGYVDYFKVEALGSVKKYPNEKQAQVDAYGPPEGHKTWNSMQKAKPKENKAFAPPGGGFIDDPAPTAQPVFPSDAILVEVYPGEYVQKVKVRP